MTIGISAAIGWIRFYKTDPAYLPFLLLLSAGFANECYGIALLLAGKEENAANFSYFRLLETYIILWQFYNWRLFKTRRHAVITAAVFTGLWVTENLLTMQHSSFSSWFTLMQSLLIVVLSISQINRILWKDNIPLWRNAVFLVCAGLITFFVFALFTEMFLVLRLKNLDLYHEDFQLLMITINFLVNILFIWAVLSFPVKMKYLLRS